MQAAHNALVDAVLKRVHERSGGVPPQPQDERIPAESDRSARVDDSLLLSAAAGIHEAGDLGQLGEAYVALASRLVRANAYGCHLLQKDQRVLLRVVSVGAVERYAEAYEKYGYNHDPLLERARSAGYPVSNGLILPPERWQRQDLRLVLGMQSLPHMLESALAVNEHTIAVLYFTRNPADLDFSAEDLQLAEALSAHMRIAIRNLIEHTERQEERVLFTSAFDTLGIPIWLADRAGRILSSNKPAQEALAGSDGAAQRLELTRCMRANISELNSLRRGSALTMLRRSGGHGDDLKQPLLSVTVPDTDGLVLSILQRDTSQAEHNLSKVTANLPPRAAQVLHLLLQGMSNKEIARELFITNNTVKYHLKCIYEQLGVTSRSQLLSKVIGTVRSPSDQTSLNHAAPRS